MASPPIGTRHILLQVARILALLAVALGILAGFGWLSGRVALASFGAARIPMAPSTALLFLLMGAGVLLQARRGEPTRRLRLAVAGICTLLAASLLFLASTGRQLAIEHLGLPIAGDLAGAPLGHISPLSALCFLLAGISLLAVEARHRRLAVAGTLLAGGVLIVSLVLMLAYLLGGPLLYNSGVIPPALSTAIAFLALALALVILAAEAAWPSDSLASISGARSRVALLLVFILASAGILTAGGLYFRSYQRSFRAQAEAGLAAIAELKAGELEQWRRERLGDALVLHENEDFSIRVEALLGRPEDEGARRRLQVWLDKLQTAYGYDRVFVLDAAGVERAAAPAGAAGGAKPRPALVAELLSSDAPRLVDFHQDATMGGPYLGVLVPIRSGGRPLAVLGLRIHPERQLYPRLRGWPTASRSAETLIVRREGDTVLFLSELRHREGAALSLRLPLTTPDLVAAKALRGASGVVEGVDYRGVRSVGALRAIADSPWFLVASIDAAELYAPVRTRFWTLVGLVTALLAGAGIAVGFLWEQQRSRFREAGHLAELALARSEAARRDSDILMEEMGGIAKIGGWEFDPATGTGTWTEQVARIHDLEPGDPTNVARGFSFYSGESRRRIEAAVAAAIAHGTAYDLELELVSAKGVHKWVRTIGYPRVEAGRVVHVRGSFQDISDQKRTAARIEHLNAVLRGIRNVNQLITREKDRDRLIAEACRLLVEARGFHAAVVVLTEADASGALASAAAGDGAAPWLAALTQTPLPDWARAVLAEPERIVIQAGAAGEPAAADEQPATLALGLAQDGRVYGLMLASLPSNLAVDPEEQELLSEVAGDIAFALHGMELAREHAAGAAALARTEEQLRQSQKLEAIGQLAGGVAHDFNNLLMAQMCYCESIKAALPPADPLAADVVEIMACAERAAGLTRQLLAFSRKQTLQPIVLELKAVVADIEKMLRRVIGEDIDLVTVLSPAGGRVKADPGQLEQVLVNLVVNARDAMPAGGKLMIETADVELDAEYARAHAGVVPGPYAMLAVTDTGAGMDEATRMRLFEPFFTTKERGKGTGLGLATVYGIVKQSGGNIWVYSEPGRGTTFKIYLPRVKAAATPRLQPSGLAAAGGGELLLIVEDEPHLRALFGRMVTELGYRVRTAESGEAALRVVASEDLRPDLLVTDVVLTGMGGKVLAERLRALRPGLRVLYMSGYTDNAIVHHGVLEADTPFLQKPFSIGDLAAKIRELLAVPA